MIMTHHKSPKALRKELQEDDSAVVRRRRTIIGLSLIGMGSMAVVSAFRTGLRKHLPDLPLGRFRSDVACDKPFVMSRAGV
ncbi:MAG: hypothetical protein A4E19_13985 [Nitrospira sp. SG-bin1]|nr:MAG: hypothetical protein A4E19_13985 [Nitrospira sp. SG-bin1]